MAIYVKGARTLNAATSGCDLANGMLLAEPLDNLPRLLWGQVHLMSLLMNQHLDGLLLRESRMTTPLTVPHWSQH